MREQRRVHVLLNHRAAGGRRIPVGGGCGVQGAAAEDRGRYAGAAIDDAAGRIPVVQGRRGIVGHPAHNIAAGVADRIGGGEEAVVDPVVDRQQRGGGAPVVGADVIAPGACAAVDAGDDAKGLPLVVLTAHEFVVDTAHAQVFETAVGDARIVGGHHRQGVVVEDGAQTGGLVDIRVVFKNQNIPARPIEGSRGAAGYRVDVDELDIAVEAHAVVEVEMREAAYRPALELRLQLLHAERIEEIAVRALEAAVVGAKVLRPDSPPFIEYVALTAGSKGAEARTVGVKARVGNPDLIGNTVVLAGAGRVLGVGRVVHEPPVLGQVVAAIGREHVVLVIVFNREGDIAAVIGQIRTGNHREAVALKRVVLGKTGLRTHAHALEIVAQYKVDHARYRVGAVGRRRAAGDRLDALDQVNRNRIDVHTGATGAAGNVALAAHQHQRSPHAEAAQVQRAQTRGANKAAAVAGAVGRGKGRQIVEQIAQIGAAGTEHIVGVDLVYRRRDLQIAPFDQGTGDDNFFELKFVIALRLSRQGISA